MKTLVAVLMTFGYAMAQDAPPPPDPATMPTLEDAMAFIKSRITTPFTYGQIGGDYVHTSTTTFSDVQMNGCTIQATMTRTYFVPVLLESRTVDVKPRKGPPQEPFIHHVNLALGDVDRVLVANWTTFFAGLHPQRAQSYETTQPVFMVSLETPTTPGRQRAVFLFHDEPTAYRVAKAVNHALTFCKKKEAF